MASIVKSAKGGYSRLARCKASRRTSGVIALVMALSVIINSAGAIPALASPPEPTAITLQNSAASNSLKSDSSQATPASFTQLTRAGAGSSSLVAAAAPGAPSGEAAGVLTERSVRMSEFKTSDFIPTSALRPIKLEASYNQAITLKEALDYALRNNLPIRISKESWKYQRYAFLGAAAAAMPFLPTSDTGLGQTYSSVAGSPSTTGVRSNAFVFQQIFEFPVFTGGLQFFTMAAQYYREKGWKEAHYANINDALLDVFIKYENLVLQHALLRIKARDLNFAKADLDFDYSGFIRKTAPLLEMLDAKMEFATARQELLLQQLAVRKAALELAFALNMPTAVNLVPMEKTISERLLIDEHNNINALIRVALDRRPELRQFQYFRLAAARNIPIQASQLYPNLTFFVAYSHANDIVNPVGGNVSGLATAQIASTLQVIGAPSNNALGETPSFSPEVSKTAGSSDINTIDTSVVASSGGLPQNLVQAGSLVLSGAVAPTTAVAPVTFNGTVGSTNLTGANTSSFGVFPGTTGAWQSGFLMNFAYLTGENFGSIPLPAQGFSFMAATAAARALARQAMLQANQGLQLVESQVRTSYLSVVRARDKFEKATRDLMPYRQTVTLVEAARVKEDSEALREELELAQHNRSVAQGALLQAIFVSDISQARLLHDIGVISTKTLTDGYKLTDPKEKRKRP